MREQPINRISEKGLHVWRLYGVIQTIIVLLLAIGAGILTYIYEWPWWIYLVASSVVIIYAYLFIYLFPKIKWLRWRYEVRESEIELQHGLFIVKRTLIPMVRVQHVDTVQGPILRKYNLAGITVSTAATDHEIPALVMEEADELRVEFPFSQGWQMMMSNTRYKLHWITAIMSVLKTLKEMIVPIVIIVFANGFNDTGKWYLDYLTFIISGVLLILFFVTGIIKWKRFVYWFEEDELRIESGLFVKKKRYIPFDRIQSLDYTEGILHRPFNLVKVKVETAGGSASLSAEAELTAITKEAANRIEQEIAEAKKRKFATGTDFDELLEEVVEPEAKVAFKMSGKNLLVLATTSSGVGFILSGVVLFISQFADLLPMDWMFEEVAGFVKLGLVIVGLVVLLGLLVVWGISVAMTFLAYYNFTVAIEDEDIVITRGLIEKKRATVPLNRVQSVRVIENPIRQLFGYVTVVIDNAGGGLGEGAKINLFPLVKKKAINGPLNEIFPELCFEEPTNKLQARSKRFYYRIDFLWMLPAIGALIYFFFPYGLLALLIIPIVILWGLWQHHSAAYEVLGNQLTMRFRGISLQTAYMMKKRIQSMQIKQNYFQRRRGVATISASIKSGMAAFKAEIRHMEESDADRILDWYEPTRKIEEEQ